MPEAIREKAGAWPVVLKDCHTGLSTFFPKPTVQRLGLFCQNLHGRSMFCRSITGHECVRVGDLRRSRKRCCRRKELLGGPRTVHGACCNTHSYL